MNCNVAMLTKIRHVQRHPIQYLSSHLHHSYPPWQHQKAGLQPSRDCELYPKPISLHTNHYQSQCTLRSCARCGSRNGGPVPYSSPCLLVCLSSCISGQCCSGWLQSPSHAKEKIKQIQILKPKLESCHKTTQTTWGTLGFFVGN